MGISEKVGKRPSRKGVDRKARRERVLDGALLLIEEKGLSGMSLHQLAKHLGYTVGALYRYFPSKDALLAELQSRSLRTLGLAMERVLERGRSFAESEGFEGSRQESLFLLRLLVEFYDVYAQVSPAHYRLTNQVMAESKNLLSDEDAEQVFTVMKETLSHPIRLFQQGEESGALEEGNMVERVMLLWTSMHGVMQSRKMARFSPELLDRDNLLSALSVALLRGWGAKSSDLEMAESWLAQFLEHVSLDVMSSEVK